MPSEDRPTPMPKPTAPAGLDVALRVAGGSFKPVSVPACGEAAAAPAFPRVTSAFITPRVVDQRVLDDFGGQLRRLAAGADESAAKLIEASAAAARVAQETARRQQASLDALGNLLRALDARMSEMTALIGRADERLAAAREAEASLAVVGERLASDFERSFLARMEAVGSGATDGGLPRLVDDAERVKDSLRCVIRRLERAGDRAACGAESLESRTMKADALIERGRAAERALLERIAAAHRAGEECAGRVDEAGDVSVALENLLGACAKADASLREGVRHGEDARETVTDVSRQLASLVVRALDAREDMRSWAGVLDAAGDHPKLPAALERIVQEFRESMAQDISKMAGAMSLIAQRAQTSIRRGHGPDEPPEIVIRMGEPARKAAG